jgi:predicted GNAT family acetyltransferase
VGWVVTVDGEVVSQAVSAHENARAAEVGCETVLAFRNHGYARHFAAWASDVLESNRVAFYSYDFENTASAALAASLEVVPVFDVGAFDLDE